MDSRDVLADAFGRVRGIVLAVLDGADDNVLTFRADADANSIAWLVWHLSRVQDDHVAELAGETQVWPDWRDRFNLPFDDRATGYGQSSAEVGDVRVGADLLRGYFEAVSDRTIGYLGTLSAEDLDDVVDESWDPPVTRGVRLISVTSDDLQHAGQAAYVRGLATRAAR